MEQLFQILSTIFIKMARTSARSKKPPTALVYDHMMGFDKTRNSRKKAQRQLNNVNLSSESDTKLVIAKQKKKLMKKKLQVKFRNKK